MTYFLLVIPEWNQLFKIGSGKITAIAIGVTYVVVTTCNIWFIMKICENNCAFDYIFRSDGDTWNATTCSEASIPDLPTTRNPNAPGHATTSYAGKITTNNKYQQQINIFIGPVKMSLYDKYMWDMFYKNLNIEGQKCVNISAII